MSSVSSLQQANRQARRAMIAALAVLTAAAAASAFSFALLADAGRAGVGAAPFAALLLLLGGAGLIWRKLARALARSEEALGAAESLIRDLGANDALTGAANRRAFGDHLAQAAARALRGRTRLAALIVDIDAFHEINDAHGVVAGDLALKEAARRMSALLRKGELLARYGGDEFVILAEFASEDAVRRLAHNLVEALAQPLQLGEASAQVRVSIGVAMFPDAARSEEDLLRKAELALAHAKEDGRGAVRLYDAGMDMEMWEREHFAADLKAAIEAGALAPAFQPIFRLGDGEVIGLEVLARWRHETRGNLAPQDFLPAAKAAGLMNPLTAATLKSACLAARALPGRPTLWLNVTPEQVESGWLAEAAPAILSETGFAPERLMVEITGMALIADLPAAARTIGALKRAGMHVALDNFGAGYSNLSYLAELPFDAIKISSQFVARLGAHEGAAKIVAALVALARNLGAVCVAERVEGQAQAALLRAMGCDAAQGFLFAKPMSAPEAAVLLAAGFERKRVLAIA